MASPRLILALAAGLFLAACAKKTAVATPDQGIAGRFEALGGAHPPEPGCDTLPSPRREECEREFLKQMTWPLKGFAVIRAANGDSVVLALDSTGGYRASLPPGLYQVCVQADGLEHFPNPCAEGIEVKAGAYTPYSRPFPMP